MIYYFKPDEHCKCFLETPVPPSFLSREHRLRQGLSGQNPAVNASSFHSTWLDAVCTALRIKLSRCLFEDGGRCAS